MGVSHKVHGWNALARAIHVDYTTCGVYFANVTTKIGKITCKRCLKSISSMKRHRDD